MTMKLNRLAYAKLIEEDIAWLKTIPRTLERDHIILVLQVSPEHEYGPEEPADATRPELEEAILCAKRQREELDARIMKLEGRLRR